MPGFKKNHVLLAAIAATGLCLSAQASVLFQYDSVTGNAPDDEGWSRSGFPMINIGGSYLLQDWTFDDPDNGYGEYTSPAGAIPAGTFKKGGSAYGIEVKIRPLRDVAFVGYAWPELYLSWSDDVNHYNITIDQHSEGNTSGPGDVVYGRGSFSKGISGIDWSVPHTVFIGHRSSGPDSIFDFYLDGVIKTTVVEGSIARDRTGWEFLQDRVNFGDGTTGGPLSSDIAAEWYFVKVHDTNIPVVPPSMWNVNGGGSFGVAGNWTSGVPDSNTGIATASFGTITTSAATITMEAPHTVGAVILDNTNRYTLSGSGTLGFSFPGTASIQVLTGSHTISSPVNFTSSLNVTVSTGNTLTINASSITSGPNATMIKSGDGTLELTHLRGHRLQVDAGTVEILSGSNNSSAGASKVTDLVIAGGASPTASLDLSNNTFLIDHSGTSPAATVREQIKGGFNAGDWQGIGVTSSNAAAAAAGSTKTAIGYAEASSVYSSFPATIAGQSADNTTLILKYTLSGDANLDEKINTLDFNLLAGGFGVGSDWVSGDFNYDGVVDSTDFAALTGNYGKPLPPAAPGLGSVVPEPVSGGILALAALLVRRRR